MNKSRFFQTYLFIIVPLTDLFIFICINLCISFIRSYFIAVLIFTHVAMLVCRLVVLSFSSAFITGVFELRRSVPSIRGLRRLGDD